MKRVVLFLATNFAILIVLSITANLLESWLASQGIHFQHMQLLIFAAVFGMGGSFISLAMSKWIAIRTTGAQVIEQPSSEVESWLVQTVSHQAQAAGIGMPQVAIFPSEDPNAFATGARRDKALVAVSTGLLSNMQRGEVEAVLGHEVSHIANGDMITLALIQGVLNTFVIFASRIIGGFIDRVVFKNEEGYGMGYFAAVIVTQILLGILASVIVFWFSRRREFRADSGGARLAGRGQMVAALEALKRAHDPQPLPEAMRAMGISGGGMRARFGRLFTTHPPLDERIAALQAAES